MAQFISGTRFADIPEQVLELGKKSVLDGLGVSLSGSISSAATIMRQYARDLGHPALTGLRELMSEHALKPAEVARIRVRTINRRVDYGKGSLANPMSLDEVADKFRECAQYARWPHRKAEQAISLVRDLESLKNIAELTACLAG